jgi:hypothetical protein
MTVETTGAVTMTDARECPGMLPVEWVAAAGDQVEMNRQLGKSNKLFSKEEIFKTIKIQASLYIILVCSKFLCSHDIISLISHCR